MKSTLTLEDTPQGVSATLIWTDNDTTDHPANSLSMMLMAQLTEHIKLSAKAGAIRLEKE